MLATPHNTTATRPTPAASSAARLAYLDLAEWQEFVESHPESTAFHHRNWIETIAQQYGLGIHIPCLKSGGEIEAAIPFLSSRKLFGATRLISLPFTDCLRVLSRGPSAAEALTSALTANHPPCDSMSLRTDTALRNVVSHSFAVRHEVVLPPSVSELSKKFKPSTNRNLHKARRLGLEFVKRTDEKAMEEFFRLHVLTRRKLGVPVQPKRFFGLLWKHVLAEGRGYIGLVFKGQEPVAGGVFLTFNRTVTYKYAASQPAALADRPNDWLVFNALQVAVEEGYEIFDFGISDRHHEGLRRFKRNWGAEEIDVHTVQIVGQARRPVADSRLLKLTAWGIRNSPVVVCRCLGEVFYRFAI
jgi:CelD/BcsL family acetyltransferase involved in cellulose biosynthesis